MALWEIRINTCLNQDGQDKRMSRMGSHDSGVARIRPRDEDLSVGEGSTDYEVGERYARGWDFDSQRMKRIERMETGTSPAVR
jgi:hypothetical protein